MKARLELLRAWWHANAAEAWGYVVWGVMGVVVAVPEIWAAADSKHVPWPTISGTIGDLEVHHNWIAIIVIGLIVWAAYCAILYPTAKSDTLNRTRGGRLTRATDTKEVPWWIYVPVALVAVVAGSWIAHAAAPHDKFRFGQVLYGLIAAFWIVIPSVIALPKRGREAPFATLFRTIRNLERRLRPAAVVVAAGLAVLVLHLMLYPWPAIIPDLKHIHDQYSKQGPYSP